VPVAPVLYHRVGFNPLFGHTGEDADVRTRAMGSLKIYPGADHGFMAMSARVLGDTPRDPWGQPLSWLQTFLQA
jgi:hypothetical protein